SSSATSRTPSSSSVSGRNPAASAMGISSRIFPLLRLARTSSRGGVPTRLRAERLRQRGRLLGEQSRDRPLRQRDQRVKLGAIEGAVLAGPLHLDEPSFAAHDDVHVHLGT